MKEIVLASRNKHKAEEIQILLPASVKLLTLDEVRFTSNIEEPYETFEQNALHKAQTVASHTGMSVIADDSGLMVESLNGAPGVYSARYAGIDQSDESNVLKLLREMEGFTERSAKFVCVVAFVESTDHHKIFTGEVWGKIAESVSGNHGFGYDPVFIPEGFNESFGVLDSTIKNRISHRARAFEKFGNYLLASTSW